jgi:hypothetical protein
MIPKTVEPAITHNKTSSIILWRISRSVNVFLSSFLALKLIMGLSLVLVLLLHYAYFLSYRKSLHRDLNPKQIFVVEAFVPVISHCKKQIWLWCWSSIMLSVQATENVFTRTRTKDTF